LFRSFLYLLSKMVQLYVQIHRFLIQARILRDTTLGIQVIAIGNLTVGGTGKTPVVEKFARELQNQGRTVAILTRGYRSKPEPFAQWLLNQVLFRSDTTPPGLSPTVNRSCWIPTPPATSLTCWPPTQGCRGAGG